MKMSCGLILFLSFISLTYGYLEEIQSFQLPEPPQCGVNGEGMNEFPWVVLFEHEFQNGSVKLDCAGVLINRRYVLTIAQCVYSIRRSEYRVSRVRVGEHAPYLDPDCEDRECNLPVQRIDIEDVLIYPQHRNHSDSIPALVRLERDVSSSKSVGFICLPSVMKHVGMPTRIDKLYVSGWSKLLADDMVSRAKKKATLRIVDWNECKNIYKRGLDHYLFDWEFCTSSFYCFGPYGAPLMRRINGYWIVYGIMEYFCPHEETDLLPIFIETSYFEGWIRDTVR